MRGGTLITTVACLGILWLEPSGAFTIQNWVAKPSKSCGVVRLRHFFLRSAAGKYRDDKSKELDRIPEGSRATGTCLSRQDLLKGALRGGEALGAINLIGLPSRSAAAEVDSSISSTSSESIPKGARKDLTLVEDPSSYQALAYSPSKPADGRPPPLLVVLHGAAVNNRGVWDLANPTGEHAGLAPSLLATSRAPPALADNFAVVAPWVNTPAGASAGRQSFYEEPRAKLLRFVEWVCSPEGRQAGCPEVDPSRVFLFGFSDGATVAVELLTTRRFSGAVVASYGFTGTLPPKAVDRLRGIPIWVFHCADDAIFPVACSDKLVRTLNAANGAGSLVRFSRFERDQEGFTGSVRGHSTGITASRTPEVFKWLLELPALK